MEKRCKKAFSKEEMRTGKKVKIKTTTMLLNTHKILFHTHPTGKNLKVCKSMADSCQGMTKTTTIL